MATGTYNNKLVKQKLNACFFIMKIVFAIASQYFTYYNKIGTYNLQIL